MSRRHQIAVLGFCLLLNGCTGSSNTKAQENPPGIAVTNMPHPDQGKWPADTLAKGAGTEGTWTKLPNFLVMVGPGPSGLWIRLPKDASVKPLPGMAEAGMLPKGKTASDYNLPSGVFLDTGAQILVQLFKSERGGFKVEDADISKIPGATRVVYRPWRGIRISDGKSVMYVLESSDLVLMASATLKSSSESKRASEVIEGIIASVRIDPEAKPVDYFPGAGEEEDRDVPKGTEVAMADGEVIRATTPVGTIEVAAGPGCRRSYTWEGATRSVVMDPRGERWYGSLGLYYPGPGSHWKEHNGITRGVVEEGQQHFKSTREAMAWIEKRKYMPFVYRNDGLMVGWDKTLERHQLTVEVWQILINGKKPTSLPGAKDSAIRIVRR